MNFITLKGDLKANHKSGIFPIRKKEIAYSLHDLDDEDSIKEILEKFNQSFL